MSVSFVLQFTSIQEVSLTANQPVSAMRARKLKWRTEDGAETLAAVAEKEISIDNADVTLNPLQVCVCVCSGVRRCVKISDVSVCVCQIRSFLLTLA